MRILYLSQLVPYPPDSGPKVRQYYVLRYLAQHHEVSLVAFSRPDDKPEAIGHLKSFCQAVHTVPMKRAKWRDALALAEACRLGAYRPAHRTSEEQRHVRAQLTVRDSLVRMRARLVTLAQAILSREGTRVPSGSSGCFSERVERLAVPRQLAAEIAPLLATLTPLNHQIELLGEQLSQLG